MHGYLNNCYEFGKDKIKQNTFKTIKHNSYVWVIPDETSSLYETLIIIIILG